MANEPNAFKSIYEMKCPKCRQADLFTNKKVYKFEGFFDMPEHCPKCNQSFTVESGFYFGAMYVSYGLTIALNVSAFVALMVFDSYSLIPFLILAGGATLITLPYIVKISRVIWIAMMVNYEPNSIEEYEKKNNSK